MVLYCSLLLLFCSRSIILSLATDNSLNVSQTQLISDPGFIESNRSVFRLGFFSPNGSTDRYVGIWYNKDQIPKVLWVANRQNPLKNSSGVFRISEQGNLVVLNVENEVLWSTNVSSSIASNSTSFQLMDSGNLVLQGINGDVLWQSIDFPGDALWPPIKLSSNLRTGENKSITSWMSTSNPSYGNFTVGIVPLNVPEVYIWNSNGAPHWRSGPWNGQVFIGVPGMNSVYLDGFSVASEADGTTYLSVTFVDETFFTVFQITADGVLVQSSLENGNWGTSWTTKQSICDDYATCGAFGICRATDASVCSCMRGFKPKKPDEWKLGDWSGGCVRTSEVSCNSTRNETEQVSYEEDGFWKLRNVKVPDHTEWWPYLEEKCSTECLKNCSCVAYAYDRGIGCMTWSGGGGLIDVQEFVEGAGGTDLYLRVPRSELGNLLALIRC